MKKFPIIIITFIYLSLTMAFAQNSLPKLPPPKPLTFGSCNHRATNLPQPDYPKADANVSGVVNVVVKTNEEGNVKSARAVSGHPLLRLESEKAALKAKLKPTIIEGKPVEINCILLYNFGLPESLKKEESKKETSVETVNKKAIFIPKRISPICRRKN